jgi:replicative DNA helicase
MRETATKQSAQERAVEYAQVFAPSTPQEYATFLSEIKEGIPTGYLFEQGKQREELTLNSGLTFICGYRGHGKTSFLNNIALNEARRNVALGNGKSVLYFSYEVDKRRLITDLLNTFVNDADISRTPSDTILSYFKGKGSTYFRNERRTDGRTHYENFVTQKDKFFRELLSSGALTIVDENYRVEKLLDAIKYYLSTRTASIVCIDYAQLIYSEEYSRQRTEEIKKVVNDIKDFANREGIPFVLAAQFNREVDSPISVDTKNIGEGGDFERIADTCIGLFNLKELHPLPKNKDEEKAAKKLLSDLGAATYAQGEELKPIQGKLFVRLMKRRYGYYPLDTILEWEGRTKYIKPNFEEALSTQAQQTELFSETQEDAPF